MFFIVFVVVYDIVVVVNVDVGRALRKSCSIQGRSLLCLPRTEDTSYLSSSHCFPSGEEIMIDNNNK